jgi:hypothetical protein
MNLRQSDLIVIFMVPDQETNEQRLSDAAPTMSGPTDAARVLQCCPSAKTLLGHQT